METRNNASSTANGPTETTDDVILRRAPKVSRWKAFLEYVYDSKTGKVLGRSGISWLEITGFYICFYAFLAAFFAICMSTFLSTLDLDKPKFFGKGSIIGDNPGMGYQPWLASDPESTLIAFNSSNPLSYKKYTDQIRSFLQRYENKSNTRPCSGDETNNEKHITDACAFELPLVLEHCSFDNHFGYAEGKPCVIVTLNRILGWRPVSYPSHSIPDRVRDRYVDGSVAVDCRGEYQPDEESIGSRDYVPSYGIGGRYFPYRKLANYQQPFAMVKFLNVTIGRVIQVVCRAHAYNIVHDDTTHQGMVRFELLVDR